MARPTKRTVDYFPHFTKSGKTIFIIESEFGNDGYAFWFKLLETLGSTDGMVLDWNDLIERRFFLSKARVDEDTGLKIIETLAEVEAIDPELWQKGKILWSQNLVDNVRDAFKKRTSALPQRPEISDEPEQLSFDVEVSAPETPSNVVNPSVETGKGKERERKEKEYTPQFDDFWSVYPRKLKKKDAYNAFVALMRSKESFNDIITSVRNYATQCKDKEEQYIMHATTFLRQDRWKDYLAQPKKNPQRDSSISSRDKEIAFQQWVQEGNDPDEFDWS